MAVVGPASAGDASVLGEGGRVHGCRVACGGLGSASDPRLLLVDNYFGKSREGVISGVLSTINKSFRNRLNLRLLCHPFRRCLVRHCERTAGRPGCPSTAHLAHLAPVAHLYHTEALLLAHLDRG